MTNYAIRFDIEKILANKINRDHLEDVSFYHEYKKHNQRPHEKSQEAVLQFGRKCNKIIKKHLRSIFSWKHNG